MNLISNNPLIERYRYSSLRPKQCWIYVSIFIGVIAIILAINYSILRNHPDVYESGRHMCSSLYYQFLAFLIFIAWVIAAASSSTAIRTEINERSYDFFRMLPLSSHQKALGIMIGRNLLILILGGIVAITTLVLGGFGGKSAVFLMQMSLAVCSGAVFFNCAALFASINPSRKTQNKAGNSIGILFAAIFFLPYLIAAIFSLSEVTSLEELKVPFFAAKVPILIMISILCLYFAGWIYIGILRKFDKETQPVMTRPGAFMFLAGIIAIALGFTQPHLGEKTQFLAYAAVWFPPLLFLIAMPFGYFFNREQYMEMLGRGPRIEPSDFITQKSNLAAAVMLFALWALPAVATSASVGYSTLSSLAHVAALFSFYLVFCLLCEVHSLTRSGNIKVAALLVFLGLVYLILPLILAAITESGSAAGYSMFGYFGIIMAEALEEPVDASLRYIIGLNIAWIVILALFVKSGYMRLLASRAHMQMT